jgi:UDP-N-acetylglucosamine 2-epimerase (non-hydrolysing)
MCGLQAEGVLKAIDVVTSQWSPDRRLFPLVPDYDVDNVSQKVLRILLSYTDYVNRTVWFR